MNVSDARALLKHGMDPYANSNRTKWIAIWVICAHLMVFVIIPLVLLGVDLLVPEEPPLVVMKVGLVDLPEGDSPDAPVNGEQQPIPEPPAPEPPALEPPKPEPPKPEPPKPEPPKPEPPKPEPPKPEPPKPEPPKPVPAPPKPKQKPVPPKPKYLTAADILKQRNKNRGKTVTIKNKDNRKQQQQDHAAQQAYAKQLAEYNRARQALQSARGRFGSPDAGLKGILATAEDRAYYAKLKAFVDARFVQPSDALLDGRKPVVQVQITIGKDGSLAGWNVTSPSDVQAMNDAVAALKEKLQTMPVPPRAMTIPFTFRVN